MAEIQLTPYQAQASAEIQSLIARHECQPILFVGSGLSRRYFGAPNWHDALRYCLAQIGTDGPNYAYYVQKYSDPIAIGTALSERIHEWAWTEGRSYFPAEYFINEFRKDVFIKYIISEHLKSITPNQATVKKSKMFLEIESLKKVRPHAIITTNFDNFLENTFNGYEPIVGQQVIRYNLNSFGEIFKIHGSVDDPQSIVLTKNDYDNFLDKKKYISAKLLTYLAEHPVFVFGYSFNDTNVNSIIGDIGEIIADRDGLIDNIFYINWRPSSEIGTSPQNEYVIQGTSGHFRVNAIVTDDFKWIFDALASDQELKSVNPKLVRALAARAYKLVRSDLPRGTVEVNYSVLESIQDSEEALPTLLGITLANNTNMLHPLSMTEVARRIGGTKWNDIDKLIKKIIVQKGIDLRATDNHYHCQIRSGEKGIIRKWSISSVDLFKKVQNDEEYEIKL